MALILTTAFIAIIALALPAITTPVLPRQDYPPPLGVEAGTLFPAGFTFTTFADKSCKGVGHVFSDDGAGYGDYAPWQMQSYHLSRDLKSYEILEFFTGFGTGLQNKYSVDHAMDSHYTESCLQYDSTAGTNATTDDDKDHGGGRVGAIPSRTTSGVRTYIPLLIPLDRAPALLNYSAS